MQMDTLVNKVTATLYFLNFFTLSFLHRIKILDVTKTSTLGDTMQGNDMMPTGKNRQIGECRLDVIFQKKYCHYSRRSQNTKIFRFFFILVLSMILQKYYVNKWPFVNNEALEGSCQCFGLSQARTLL